MTCPVHCDLVMRNETCSSWEMGIGDQGDNTIVEVHLMGVVFVCMCYEMLPDGVLPILDVVVWKETG